MVVKEIKEGKFSNGYVVAHLFSPRGYLKEDGKTEGDAWLSELMVLKPEHSPVNVQIYSFILAKSPARVFVLAFEPSWKGVFVSKNPIFTFRGGFIPDTNYPDESRGDLVVGLYDFTGENDNNNLHPGAFPYSSDLNRRIILHGAKKDLENMLLSTINKPIKGEYDLEFTAPCCANGKKKYTFEMLDIDIIDFVKIASYEISKLAA